MMMLCKLSTFNWQRPSNSSAGFTTYLQDANSKLVEVVSLADEDRVGNSLLQIWELSFGHKAKVCSNFEHKIWSIF